LRKQKFQEAARGAVLAYLATGAAPRLRRAALFLRPQTTPSTNLQRSPQGNTRTAEL